jgi:hypothetical protein
LRAWPHLRSQRNAPRHEISVGASVLRATKEALPAQPAARARVFRLKRQRVELVAIEEQLGVRAVVTGRITLKDERLDRSG